MRAFADTARPVAEVSPMIYGQFIEHFHRQVYGGIFGRVRRARMGTASRGRAGGAPGAEGAGGALARRVLRIGLPLESIVPTRWL